MGTVPKTTTLTDQRLTSPLRSLVDETAGHQIVIDELHHQIHEGILFSTGFSVEVLADNGSLDIFVQTPTLANALHAQMSGAASGDGQAQLFEDVTVSDPGTPLPVINRNRSSTTVTTALFFEGPTVTGFGTTLFSGFVPGGQRNQAFGAELSSFAEYTLKGDTNYLLRLTNLSGGDAIASININFYDLSLEEAEQF